MAEIVDIKETDDGPVYTIVSKRGERHVVSATALATAWVDFLSDKRNEDRGGWELNTPWYVSEINRIRSKSKVEDA